EDEDGTAVADAGHDERPHVDHVVRAGPGCVGHRGALAHSRHAWMSVTMIPRAPRSQSLSITAFVSLRLTIDRTADQPFSCRGETVGDSMPGVIATACSTRSSAMS